MAAVANAEGGEAVRQAAAATLARAAPFCATLTIGENVIAAGRGQTR